MATVKKRGVGGVAVRSHTVHRMRRPGTEESLPATRKSRSASESGLPTSTTARPPRTPSDSHRPPPRTPSDSHRPPRTPSAKRRKSLRNKSVSSIGLGETAELEEDLPPPPKPAWEQFAEHIKAVSIVGPSYSASSPEYQLQMNQLIDTSGSDICKKILKDMKDQLERKRLKELAALERMREAEESAAAAAACGIPSSDEDSDAESDSEDESEKQAKQLKAEAQRYWGIIRRDVQERIRIRKEKNPAGGTWNNLRAQLRALTRGNNVRQELYEKYGIVPKPGCKSTEDSMKPTLTIDIKEVINRFQSFQVRKLKVTFA